VEDTDDEKKLQDEASMRTTEATRYTHKNIETENNHSKFGDGNSDIIIINCI